MTTDDPNPESLDAVLARLHMKVDMLQEDMKEVKKMVQGHDQFKYWVLGIAALFGALTSKALSWIVNSK